MVTLPIDRPTAALALSLSLFLSLSCLQLGIFEQWPPGDCDVRVRVRLSDLEGFELFQHQQGVELLGGLLLVVPTSHIGQDHTI